MQYLKIKDWEEWQSYRKDRGTPPWIKIHRNLLSNPKWAALSDTEKGQIVSIWIVAADADGRIPCSPYTIKKICQLDSLPDVNKFKELGLLVVDGCQVDAKLASTWRHGDAPETETETETEIKNIKKEILKSEPKKETELPLPDWLPMDDWNDYLEMRKRKGKPALNRAKQLIIIKLHELRKTGHDPGTVLRESIMNGWTGVFPIKEKNHGYTNTKPSPHADFTAGIALALNELNHQ